MNYKLIVLDSVPSTQSWMEERLSMEDVAENTIAWAKEQSAGYGQDGNSWESEPNANLTFSILLKPEFLPASEQFLLNQSIALGVTDYLKSKGGIVAPISLKWPNDFYLGRKKTGGMILNNAVTGNKMTHSIAGIGLNINQLTFASDCPNPTSLKLETGITYSLQQELHEVLQFIFKRYKNLEEGAMQQIRQDYLENMYLKGVGARYIYQGNEIHGIIEGVDEFGRLLLRQDSGIQCCCDIKEIQFLY